MFGSKWFWFVSAFLAFLFMAGGCSDSMKQANTMEMLQQGKAKGSLVLTTDGRVSVGQSTTFFLGGDSTAVSFTGEIDYSEPVGPN